MVSGSGNTQFNKSDLEDAIRLLRGVQKTVTGPEITRAIGQNSITQYMGGMGTDAGMKWMATHVSTIAAGVSTQLNSLSTQAGYLATLLQQTYDGLGGQDSTTSTDYNQDAGNISARN
jgi:hypothetical protein